MTDTKPLNTNGANTALKIEKLLKSLIECMSQETMALKAHNQSVAGQMTKEKIRLLTTYKAIAAELEKNPDMLKNVDEDIKKQLQGLIGEFDITLKDNITAIQSGRSAVSRLINRLLNKAREAVNNSNRNYDSKGKLVEQRVKSTFTPTQLNEVY